MDDRNLASRRKRVLCSCYYCSLSLSLFSRCVLIQMDLFGSNLNKVRARPAGRYVYVLARHQSARVRNFYAARGEGAKVG